MSYNKKVWYGVRPKCEVSQLTVAPVDIAHFSSALYMLAAGMLIATVIFVLEIIFDRRKRFKTPSKK